MDVFKDFDGEGDIMYRIDLDNRGWNWTEEMFEPERGRRREGSRRVIVLSKKLPITSFLLCINKF